MKPRFHGETFVEERDGDRLASQLERVRNLLLDSRWRTLGEIAAETHSPEASVSARLRDLRRAEHGGYLIQREYVERGLFRYRLIVGQMELIQ